MMTIADYPDYLAVGYLLNQNMLLPDDEITGIEYDDDSKWSWFAPPARRISRISCARRR